MKTVFALLFALWILPTPARAAEECSNTRKTIGAIIYQVIKPDNERCWYTVRPNNTLSLFYRDFLFDDNGFLMVFSSYGPGDDDTTAGAREFYFFPRSQKIKTQVTSKGVRFTLTNGVSMLYSAQTARFTDAKGATVRENSDVKSGDRGGFEIRPSRGIVLDFGFLMGGSPAGDQKGKAVFTDAKGNECSVYNSEILNWDSQGEATLKASTDAAMKSYLATRCPNLTWL